MRISWYNNRDYRQMAEVYDLGLSLDMQRQQIDIYLIWGFFAITWGHK